MIFKAAIFWCLLGFIIRCAVGEPFRLNAESVPDGVTDLSRHPRHFIPPSYNPNHPRALAEDFELLDVVLVVSVDGKFHALNRTTGHLKWSMPDDPVLPAEPSLLHHLVRTNHGALVTPDIHSDFSDADETYIIEPQTGDIFVQPSTSTPATTPLQRLPYSMPQLVELSPFRFATDDKRVFVGRKETSMITLDLNTGRVISVYNADKCFWPDPDAKDAYAEGLYEEDTDTFLSNAAPPPRVREIHVGRTDYHVAVLVHGKGIIQDLAFSSYGPNNIDRDKQADWRSTPDDQYLQPLPDGTVLSFDFKEPREPLKWSNQFRHPIVAVFDLLASSHLPAGHEYPLALLQPRPALTQIFSDPKKLSELVSLPEKTYIGLVGDSLFAMSHVNFPLVSFSELETAAAITIGEVEGEDSEESSACRGLRCFVGTHLSQSAAGTRISRLIEGSNDKPAIEASSSGPSVSTSTSTVLAIPDFSSATPPDTQRSPPNHFGVLVVSGILGLIAIFGLGYHSVRGRDQLAVASVPSQASNIGLESVVMSKDVDLEDTTAQPNGFASAEADFPKNITSESQDPGKPVHLQDDNGDMDSDKEDGEGDVGTSALRKKRRRKRGKGKKGNGAPGKEERDAEPTEEEYEKIELPNNDDEPDVLLDKVDPTGKEPEHDLIYSPALAPVAPSPPSASSLFVSDTVLGFGSHGTVVYRGSFQGRAVAVKRLLQDFVTLASREVELLQESDDHPNVIRYYYKESKDNFLYIALELCPASLEDILSRPDSFKQIYSSFDPKRALQQITAGLRHLHSLKIVHRDIKPQNILISQTKNGVNRMLISDFGLCKKLESDETSFLPTRHGPMGAGTVGWRAPEILRGEVKLDEQTINTSSLGGVKDEGDSTIGSVGTTSGAPTGSISQTRLTKSVDIFALGCLFYYTLSGGEHPFGGPFDREANILKNEKSMDCLVSLEEEGTEAEDLIGMMLDPNPRERPDTTTCLVHPYFWNPARRLGFLQDASDRFEIMCRDPPEEGLLALESNAEDVVGSDWHRRLDKIFIENLGKFRKYNGKSLQDLLRALRNKKHHYQDLPENVKKHLGNLPDGFLRYFTQRFPRLFLHVYHVIEHSDLRHEPMFKSYFELGDP